MKKFSQEKVIEATTAIRDVRNSILAPLKQRLPRVIRMKLGKNVSGYYLAFGWILLNARYLQEEDMLKDPKWLSILAHEMEHMRQGPINAYSVHGELEAWQVGFAVLESYGIPLSDKQKGIMEIPVKMERNVLRLAQQRMRDYAGDKYGIQHRPLYPFHLELLHWFGLKS